MTRNESHRQAIQRRLNAIARRPMLQPAQEAEPNRWRRLLGWFNPGDDLRTDGYRLR